MLFGLKTLSESFYLKIILDYLLTVELKQNKTQKINEYKKLNDNGNTGLNQFPVGNENYQGITMKQSIPTRKYIAMFYAWI